MNEIEKMMRVLEFVDTGYQGGSSRKAVLPRQWRYVMAACAVTVIVAVVSLSNHNSTELHDTFDSPEMAYAKLEQSFGRIASAMDKEINKTEYAYQKINYETNE